MSRFRIPLPLRALALLRGGGVAGALCICCLSSQPAFAQRRTWVALDPGQPAGTPARLMLDPRGSSSSQSTFDLFVYGFWTSTEMDFWGVAYERIEVPGLGVFDQTGAPDLPAVRITLAIPTAAQVVTLGSLQVVAEQRFMSMRVAPLGVPEEDEEQPDPGRDRGPGNANGTPGRWELDPNIYTSSGPWPPEQATAPGPIFPWKGVVPSSKVTLHPFQWDPRRMELRAASHLRVRFDHAGAPRTFPALTRDRHREMDGLFTNWPAVSSGFVLNIGSYTGRYLFITPEQYLPQLEPLIDHRKACGFALTVLTTQQTGSACANIRTAIASWYAAGASWYDHYCLLVGDTDVIATCTNPTGTSQTDDLYGSPSDGDLEEEVYVGRITMDTGADVAHIVAKILDYELTPVPFGDYDEVLLTAHLQDAPGKYVAAHEAVATAAYAVPPVFLRRYGTNSTNAQVLSDIQAQVGLVAYRGHGSTNAWTGWNFAGEDFHKNEVLAITSPLAPVVWSLSCTNNNIGAYAGTSTDCIGEAWLEAAVGGVAHYGAIRTSGTTQNHKLDEALFRAVYDTGLTIHGQAIAAAEHDMELAYPTGENSWFYLLLGDPAMRIRRHSPKTFRIPLPSWLQVGRNAVRLRVQDERGAVQPDVLVSAYKPVTGPNGGGDEILVSGYTDSMGLVVLNLDPQTLGTIQMRWRDEDGNCGSAVIPVRAGQWTDLGDAKPGVYGKPDFYAAGSLLPGAPTHFELSNAAQRAPAVLFISSTDLRIPFLGGILHTGFPTLDVALMTDARGMFVFDVPWPAGAPSGSELYFQFAVIDAAASSSVALSNALQAVMP